MAKIQKIKKTIFVHTIEIFSQQILICVGLRAEEIKKWADKNSKNLKEILQTDDNFKKLQEISLASGFVVKFSKDGLSYYILWLKEYENHWDHLDVLNHEIVHLRQFTFLGKNIENEIEFEAYFQESVFKSIRTALSKKLK